jgi:hypothetical protein
MSELREVTRNVRNVEVPLHFYMEADTGTACLASDQHVATSLVAVFRMLFMRGHTGFAGMDGANSLAYRPTQLRGEYCLMELRPLGVLQRPLQGM